MQGETFICFPEIYLKKRKKCLVFEREKGGEKKGMREGGRGGERVVRGGERVVRRGLVRRGGAKGFTALAICVCAKGISGNAFSWNVDRHLNVCERLT